MIFTWIIIALMQLLIWVLSLFSFIGTPLEITQGLASAVDFMMLPFGIVQNYIGAGFLKMLILINIVILPVLYSYILLRWILTKVKIMGGEK